MHITQIIHINNIEHKNLNDSYDSYLKAFNETQDRHARLVKMVISIIKRGEEYQYAKAEVLKFNSMCNPPDSEQEVLWQLDDMWRRYATS